MLVKVTLWSVIEGVTVTGDCKGLVAYSFDSQSSPNLYKASPRLPVGDVGPEVHRVAIVVGFEIVALRWGRDEALPPDARVDLAWILNLEYLTACTEMRFNLCRSC